MVKNRKRIILIAVVLFLGLITTAIWYANKFILPQKVKAFIVESLKAQTNRNVSVESVSYNIFKGIVIKNLVIYDNPAYGEREFLKVEAISFNLLYFPVLKQKIIFIPVVYINHPYIIAQTKEENNWNFSDIPFMEQLTRPQTTKQKFSVVIRRINIFDGRLFFKDDTAGRALSKDIRVDKLSIFLALPAAIKFKTSLEIDNLKENPTSIYISADIQPYKKYTSLIFEAKELHLTEYLAYYGQFVPMHISGGKADVDARFLLKNNLLTGTLESQIIGLKIKEGDFNLEADGILSSDAKYDVRNKNSLTYNGKATVKNCSMKGLPFINSITNAAGKVTFSEKVLKVEQLQGKTYDCPISLNGYLKDYENPFIDFLVKTDFDLSKLKYLLPKDFYENFKDFKTQGTSTITARLKGYPAKTDSPLGFNLIASVTDGKLVIPYLQQPFTAISANVSLDNNKLIWQDVKFKYTDYDVTTKGSVVNFNEPYVEADVNSKQISLSTNFNIKDKVISLNKLQGNYLNNSFSLLGNITDFSDPLLNIYGNAKLDLKSIQPIVPKQIKDVLTNLNITGTCDGSMILNGKWKDWQGWDLTLKANSPIIVISGFKLNNVSMDYRMKDKYLYLREMTAAPYEGSLSANASLNLESQDNPYLINLEIKDVKLELLKHDTPWAAKDISGLLNIKTSLNGYGMKLENLKGNGYIYMKDGKLWEAPLLRGIADLLFLPGFDKIVFKDAFGTFLVENKYIYTNDFQLGSDEVILLWQGRVGFDKSIDFAITVNLTEEFVAKSTTLGKLTTVILGQAGRFVDIRLSGTLAEPKYSMVPFVGKIFNNDVIKTIKDVFGDIFE